jgi:CRISPR-associated protein Csm2
MQNRGQSGRSGSHHGEREADRSERVDVNFDVSRVAFGEKIDPHLYSDVAEAITKDVARDCRDRNKPSQLRRFYDELVMLQDRVGSDQQRFEQLQPFVQMLKAKVAYAEGRKKVDNKFSALLRHVVDESKDHKRLRQARLFMEAFMAFYKVHGPKD